MTTSEIFKEWCRDSFSFLKEYHFKEEPLPNSDFINKYQVIFSKDDVKLIVLGEGYCAIASVLFVSPSGEEIPYGLLDKKNKTLKNLKRKGKKELSQKEQIYFAGQFIRDNLKKVLNGDYSLLNQLGKHFAEQREKRNEALTKFLNDPEAQAERAAKVAISEAGHAFKKKNYKQVVKLLETHIKYLSKKQIDRLKTAQSQLK